jgi:hypothetical protein
MTSTNPFISSKFKRPSDLLSRHDLLQAADQAADLYFIIVFSLERVEVS